MHRKVMLPVLVAFVVAVVGSSAVKAQEFAGCPIVDDKGANVTFLPNPYNCTTFYMCAQGLPVLMECPGDLRFNHALNVCDNPWKTACIELPLPEPELPTTEAPVVTEKIVITKTVKEVYQPVDDTA
ncbi:uncharacterized protein [Dermacentor albipictus]|uniref:uncharacterized protein n=1 Tax=Dermacentor albipictus TaxID=60249 RepID=UPI0031FC1964